MTRSPDEMALKARPLTAAAFAPFGDVIESEGRNSHKINEDACDRFHDLAAVDVAEAGGRPLINIFRSAPTTLPLKPKVMERHPLGSQAFVPMGTDPFLVVVAPAGDPPGPGDLHAFITNGRQGVNYARGVWHHPLVVLKPGMDFLVVDRGGAPGAKDRNCDEIALPGDRPVMIVV